MLFGMLLVGALCFEAGFIQGRVQQGTLLVISLPSVPEEGEKEKPLIQGDSLQKNDQIELIGSRTSAKNCLFVGSKNSNKYHLATCAVAKRIKLENRICFSTKEEAQARGYLPSCLK